MDVKTLINPSAKAIRVVDLQKGTVYKRVRKEYSDNYKLVYGVVLDILNGKETFIEVAEINKEYSKPEFSFELLGKDSDLNLYPTTKEEMKEYFASIDKSFQESIKEAEAEVVEKQTKYELYKSITSENFIKINDTKTALLEA